MGDAIVPKLVALGPDTISSAEDGIHETRAFLSHRAALFLSLPELQKLKTDVDARWRYEAEKSTGLLLDDEPPPPLDAATIEAQFKSKQSGRRDFPDGYYEGADGKALVVVARSPIAGGDLDRMGPAIDRIKAAVASAQATSPDFAGIKVTYAGTLPTGYREYGVVRDDLSASAARHRARADCGAPVLPARQGDAGHGHHHRGRAALDVRADRDRHRPPQHRDRVPHQHRGGERHQHRHPVPGALLRAARHGQTPRLWR